MLLLPAVSTHLVTAARRSLLGGLCLAGLLAEAPQLAAQDAAAASAVEAAYLRMISAHFGISPTEATHMAEDLGAAEEVPVVFLLARESGLSPSVILSRRQRAGPAGATSWIQVARQLQLGAGVFHVVVPDDEVDDRIRGALNAFQETPRVRWADVEISDDDVVALTHLRVLSRQLGVSKGEILRARTTAGSWVDSIRHLMGSP
jgi:hypothetical protein